MREIIVYKSEAQAGLTEQIRKSNSIAFVCKVEPCADERHKSKILSLANETEDSDILYPTKSVLVSTNWNKNDDVFLKEETWAARHTPRHKPTNIEHDKKQIVGHITDTWAIDDDGNIIPDNSLASELPDFHLCNGAVIYKYFPGEAELTARSEKLIEEIEAGEKYVSMECLFPAFDYGFSKGSELKVVSRNEDTAFLTKHLRIYGGAGEYNGYKVGRVLRNIEFSGKGYVDKPANPNSIIFSSDSKFAKAMVINTTLEEINKVEAVAKVEEIIATEENNGDELKMTIEEKNALEAKLAEVTKANKELSDKLAAVEASKFDAQIADLKDQVTKAGEEKNSLSTKITDLEKNLADANSQLAEVTKAKEEAETKVKESEIAALKAKRVSTLVEGGMEKEAAASNVEKFANLNDEQFSEVAKALVASSKADQIEDVSTKQIVDDLKADDNADLGAAAADNSDDTNKVIEGLASYFATTFGSEEDEEDKE